MTEAKNLRLVLAWECGACGHLNFHLGSNTPEAVAAKQEFAEEMGCDPDDLAALPERAFCIKCEELNKFNIQLPE